MFTVPCDMPNGLQGTREGLWIIDQRTDDVLLVDRKGKLRRRFQTETENGSGITYGNSALWLGSNAPIQFRKTPKPTDRKATHLLKVDPKTGATLAACLLDGLGGKGGGVHGVEWAEGFIWVTRPGIKLILKMDPVTFKVVHQIPSPLPRSHGLAWENGTLWCVYTSDRVIIKQDPKDGRELGRIEIPQPYPQPHALTIWNGDFIFCDADAPEGHRGEIWRIVR
jgi:hypothetical protein